MKLEQAEEIVKNWGKFLELANGNLMKLFAGQIPKRLLPYEKEVIEEALKITIDYAEKHEMENMKETLKGTVPFLSMYIDDEKAIKQAIENFSNEEFLKKN